MAEERIKGIKQKTGTQRPRKNTDEGGTRDELSPEELEGVAGGAAYMEEDKKKPIS